MRSHVVYGAFECFRKDYRDASIFWRSLIWFGVASCEVPCGRRAAFFVSDVMSGFCDCGNFYVICVHVSSYCFSLCRTIDALCVECGNCDWLSVFAPGVECDPSGEGVGSRFPFLPPLRGVAGGWEGNVGP